MTLKKTLNIWSFRPLDISKVPPCQLSEILKHSWQHLQKEQLFKRFLKKHIRLLRQNFLPLSSNSRVFSKQWRPLWPYPSRYLILWGILRSTLIANIVKHHPYTSSNKELVQAKRWRPLWERVLQTAAHGTRAQGAPTDQLQDQPLHRTNGLRPSHRRPEDKMIREQRFWPKLLF